MSHLLRRPLFQSARLSPFSSTRCFSTYRPLLDKPNKHEGGGGYGQMARPRQQAERSMRVVSREAGMIPNDVGLLEGTFINPTGHNHPKLRPTPSSLKSLLKLKWKHLRFRVRDLLSLVIIKISSPKDPAKKSIFRRTIKIRSGTIVPTAKALHRQMYTSVAEGDVRLLRKICVDGIYDQLAPRIQLRPKNETVTWELVKYVGRVKLISNRAARLPVEGMAIRQAVVRIRSRQKLTRMVKGEVVQGSGKEKDVVEYFVVQKIIRDWRDEPWMVWGTTTETGLDVVEEWDRRLTE